MEKKPKIAILRWEGGRVPEGLMQLETLPGNSTNPKSYPFPVRLQEVRGACVETIITHPSEEVFRRMVTLCREMKEEGIKAVSTSCGFNALHQQRLAGETGMPIFTSAILQVPFVQQMIGKDNTVGVITASRGNLTEAHFRACGITEDMHVKVFGLEDCREWSKIFDKPDEAFDMEAVEKEIVGTAKKAVAENPDIKAIVLECTDLPPFGRKISEATGLPVFDFVTMMAHVAVALGEIKVY